MFGESGGVEEQLMTMMTDFGSIINSSGYWDSQENYIKRSYSKEQWSFMSHVGLIVPSLTALMSAEKLS